MKIKKTERTQLYEWKIKLVACCTESTDKLRKKNHSYFHIVQAQRVTYGFNL